LKARFLLLVQHSGGSGSNYYTLFWVTFHLRPNRKMKFIVACEPKRPCCSRNEYKERLSDAQLPRAPALHFTALLLGRGRALASSHCVTAWASATPSTRARKLGGGDCHTLRADAAQWREVTSHSRSRSTPARARKSCMTCYYNRRAVRRRRLLVLHEVPQRKYVVLPSCAC
jgi:hypothetical protein